MEKKHMEELIQKALVESGLSEEDFEKLRAVAQYFVVRGRIQATQHICSIMMNDEDPDRISDSVDILLEQHTKATNKLYQEFGPSFAKYEKEFLHRLSVN